MHYIPQYVLSQRNYENFLADMNFKLKSDPKRFFNFVNMKRKSSSFPSSMRYENSTSSIDSEISNLFVDFLQTTYNNSTFNSTNLPVDRSAHTVQPFSLS